MSGSLSVVAFEGELNAIVREVNITVHINL
jgi:hypothetical protein